MTNPEFSNEFDILYNNITSNQAPGLDDYEKSVFLTKAQEDIVLAYYTGKNESGDYFEGSEEVRQYLYTLIQDIEPDRLQDVEDYGISNNSKFFQVKDIDYLYILSEYVQVKVDENTTRKVKVIPVTADEFLRIESNPFRGPSKSRVLRLDVSIPFKKGRIHELITTETIDAYRARVLLKPTPIVIGRTKRIINDEKEYYLPQGLSINGVDKNTECSLPESLHRKILDRAVLLAKASFASNPGQ